MSQHNRQISSDKDATSLTYSIRQTLSNFPIIRQSAELILPSPLKSWLTSKLMSARPDRQFMESYILPQIAAAPKGKCLFVGCQPYTRHYGTWFMSSSVEFWTTDIDPDSAQWGEPHRHYICGIEAIDAYVPAHSMDVVVMNGVFGFGLNDEADKVKALQAIHHILKPQGHLVVGWNGDPPGQNPLNMSIILQLFKHSTRWPFAPHTTLEGTTHIYDFFTAS